MDPQIAILPPEVIDQIAAGEVIERPSSVVKELVDNAIDAGARTIVIDAQAGGRELVRVTDDGCGMSPDNAIRAFERHATSKLGTLDDLWDLRTMGFRGEALPSIASVARLALTTRRASDLAATRVTYEAGRRLAVEEIGGPAGTTVEVTGLLANVPARLKFLKGEPTEASHVTELVQRLALAHPHIHFKLRHNGRVALDVPPDRDGFARVQAIVGGRTAGRMVHATGEEGGIRVTAYLAAPELAQTTARSVQLFAGPRAVRDRGLLHALAMGYGELIPRGRYPIAVVVVDAPPGSVDINVHPQKLEVRFAEPQAVYAAVRHVVAAAVASAAWRADVGAGPIQLTAIASVAAPALPFDGPATPLAQRYAAQLRSSTQLGFDASPRGWAARIKENVRMAREPKEWARGSVAEHSRAAPVPPAGELTLFPDERPRLDPFGGAQSLEEFEAGLTAAPTEQLAEGSAPHSAFFSGLRFLGQLDLTYLVCEADGALVLIDQHAAHERVELARLHARHVDAGVPAQKLLFPITLDATAEQLRLVSQCAALLTRVGFEAEGFGKATIAVKAVPAGIRHGEPAQLLRKLLAEWADDGAPSDAERIERVLAEIACHSVVRAGDRLAPSEVESLLRSLDDVPAETRNPHGRPVMMRLPLGDIAKRFGR